MRSVRTSAPAASTAGNSRDVTRMWSRCPLYRQDQPLLGPVRRVIPPIGGLDFSALFVLIALQALTILLR